jgi:hypothetical protein
LRRRQALLNPRQLVFVDETSVSTTITRLYGRAPQGERLVQKVLHGNWKTPTFIAALRHNRRNLFKQVGLAGAAAAFSETTVAPAVVPAAAQSPATATAPRGKRWKHLPQQLWWQREFRRLGSDRLSWHPPGGQRGRATSGFGFDR